MVWKFQVFGVDDEKMLDFVGNKRPFPDHKRNHSGVHKTKQTKWKKKCIINPECAGSIKLERRNDRRHV